MPKDGSLSAEIAGQIRTAILAHQAAGGYIDIGCLNAWLCFGGDWKPLEKILNARDLWNRVAKTDYNADGYLDGLIIEAADYRELLQKYRAEKRCLCLTRLISKRCRACMPTANILTWWHF